MSRDGSTKKPWIQLHQLADDLGEDPGKWLDGPLDPLPRIRGLSSIAAVRGWIGAERKIARIRDRNPREDIIAALEQREKYLQSIDEEPERRDGREVPEKRALLNGEPWDQVDRSGALASIGTSQDPPVASDGGADRGE